jgi:hypothetical protein
VSGRGGFGRNAPGPPPSEAAKSVASQAKDYPVGSAPVVVILSTLCPESRQLVAFQLSINSTTPGLEIKMSQDFDAIEALMNFSVGTLDGRDAMMVIELAGSPEELARGVRRQMPVAMTPHHARELGEALLLAAKAALMGDTPSYAVN